ncbi:MAG: hypothetical protein EHM49_07760 [Deltaproteobacteria bacterium]|nr:MAG: hypothetical protein EHM49_07760 [Deltaproteobacteria bacterium]
MVTTIRVHTFLKYARTHLQEAGAALREDRSAVAVGRCSDMAIALIKAMAASLPRIKKDFMEMDNKALYKAISDLTYTPDEARQITRSVCELRKTGESCNNPPSRAEAKAVFSKAEETFRLVHDLCVG